MKTSKQQLALAWDQLKNLGGKMNDLSHHELNLELVEIEQKIAEARRLILVGGFKPVYSIGIEVDNGEFAFTHGPTPDLKEMLSVIPFGSDPTDDLEKHHILRFEGTTPFVEFVWSTPRGQWVREMEA